MNRPLEQLRADALAIWQAGVEAVRSDRLVRQTLRVDGNWLFVEDELFDLRKIGRILVVGAGKAGAGMAAGVEEALGPQLLEEKQVSGWINVPADCVRPLSRIHLHAARPAGVNEPTEAGVLGTEEILRRVWALSPNDLCLCLISGGGSALLPAPAVGITLADKLAVTRHLSAAGAKIEELNAVRKQLSRIKGGGLARACRAQTLVTLIISDVLGDPLATIASGPTIPDDSSPRAAIEILHRHAARGPGIPERILDYLRTKAATAPSNKLPSTKIDLVIGNNATAVDAAGQEAVARGYSPAMISSPQSEGLAEDVGRHLANMALRMRDNAGPDCLISGGEPVVRLVDAARRGLGGRNQQLALAALVHLTGRDADGIVVLSGGTDGEDGPTDAAGAWFDTETIARAARLGLDPASFLERNDAYHFFEPLGGLLRTGPTHTNVCDLRVVVVERRLSLGERTHRR